MCYSKADGGYRCMPSQGLLNAYRGSAGEYVPTGPTGAFWARKKEPIPQLLEITEDAAALRYSLIDVTLEASEFETEVIHLGNMITRYSDAKVDDFDRRLRGAQSLYFSYMDLADDPRTSKLDLMQSRKRLIDTNLSLGFEVRTHLRDTMEKIVSFNKPFAIGVNGDPEFASMLYSASKFFPSSWNNALESNMTLDFVSGSDESWYRMGDNRIQITEGGENFSSYPNMAVAQAVAAGNRRQYETQIEMVHELSHKFESINPSIYKLARSFLERRALPDQGYDFDLAGEVEDHFASSYVGTLYGSRVHSEVFSMGMESTFLGTRGSLIGLALPLNEDPHQPVLIFRPDIEHRNLTLGILACLTPSFNRDTMGGPIKSVFGDDSDDEELVL